MAEDQTKRDVPTLTVLPIASGSNGNAMFIASGETRLLIDVGVSLLKLEQALADLGQSLRDLHAVFITHEHHDHVSSLGPFHRRYPDVPIFATMGTGSGWRTGQSAVSYESIRGGCEVRVGDLVVLPFRTSHDAAEPVGFRVSRGATSIALATDLGEGTPEVKDALSGCRLLVLEANHDGDMLRDGPYPPYLKRRIRSRFGHLSNHQSRRLLQSVVGPELKHVVLAHLSAANNTRERAVEEVERCLVSWPNIGLSTASRRSPSELIHVHRCTRSLHVSIQGQIPFDERSEHPEQGGDR